ncbi:MAG: hypothetical protein GF350_13730 [Chitinivibrionales bacterium]|nr:hypothetical protein [Chitinivibrionales bacterium]
MIRGRIDAGKRPQGPEQFHFQFYLSKREILMPKEWHDINEPGFMIRQSEPGRSQSAALDIQSASPTDGPRVILRNGSFMPGPDGYAFTKKTGVKIEVEEEGNSGEKISGLVTFSLFSRYKGIEMNHNHEIDANIRNGIAEGELTLYYDENYYDNGMPENEIVEYFFRARHKRCADIHESMVLEMPRGAREKLLVRLDIDPEDEEAQDDLFTLRSTDEAGSYNKTLSVKDDADSENQTLDLLFADIDPSLRYTLEASYGDGEEPEILFENVTVEELTHNGR